jgi:amino acid adenylation domain-containing protein
VTTDLRYLLQHGLEHHAISTPTRPAAVDGERTITYAELDGRANQLAHLLLELGISRGDRVGIYLDKSLESLAAIYGILKSGAAYVPFDPQAPPSRLAYIATDCGIRHLVSGIAKAPTWSDVLADTRVAHVIVPDAADVEAEIAAKVSTARDIDAQASTRPDTEAISTDLGYILYTSGSTGVPKGVMLSHENGMAFVRWAVAQFGVGSDDRLSSHAPLHFDLSIFDLYAASSSGASLYLVPPQTSYFPIEISRFIERNRITVWYSVPSILNMLLQRGHVEEGAFPDLRTILFAGEVFPTKYLRRLMALLPHVRFSNLYGPTETNVCTWYDVPEIPEARVEPIPIGRAIDGVEVFAVTDDGRQAEVGEVGELYARGPTVMQGYWGDLERTSRSLVANPVMEHVRDPAYRTGDLVTLQPDGEYVLLGRRDHQIKTRGYRVELGDIESALYAHPAIEECAVVAVPDELITNRIKAYVVARDDVDGPALVRYCSERLPKHMIPETFEIRDALPKTSTGKVDRQALTATN